MPRDNLQGISFDRWLIRLKDVVIIAGSVLSLIYAGYKFVNRIDRMNDKIESMQTQIQKLQSRIYEEQRKNRERSGHRLDSP